jgi:hypothetical protein
VVCFFPLFGVLGQSGGTFLHMATNKPGKWSAGNSVTIGRTGDHRRLIVR